MSSSPQAVRASSSAARFMGNNDVGRSGLIHSLLAEQQPAEKRGAYDRDEDRRSDPAPRTARLHEQVVGRKPDLLNLLVARLAHDREQTSDGAVGSRAGRAAEAS